MLTIDLGKIEEGEVKEVEIRISNNRIINLSINKHNMAIQMPVGVNTTSTVFGGTSTYIRTQDWRHL